MTKDQWLAAAFTNDVLVAELLLRLKHHSSSDSLKPRPPTTTTTTSTSPATLVLPVGWGNRKNRSKPTAPTTTVSIGFGKEYRASPTTHLSWSGGGGSSSDGYDDSSRPSDLSSGSRSVKANEVASTSKSQKRKSFLDLKEEEGTEFAPNLNREMDTSKNLKRIKVVKQSCRVVEEGEMDRGFILPDLNMTPSEEMWR